MQSLASNFQLTSKLRNLRHLSHRFRKVTSVFICPTMLCSNEQSMTSVSLTLGDYLSSIPDKRLQLLGGIER